MKPAHYRGDYDARSRKLVARANANPATICWRCGRRLEQHPRHKNGAAPKWTAGHVRDGDTTSPLLPEVSTCNYSAGARTPTPEQMNATIRW